VITVRVDDVSAVRDAFRLVLMVVGSCHDAGAGFVFIAQVDEDGRVHRRRRPNATTGKDALERLLFMMGHCGSLLDRLHYQLDDASVVTRANRLLSNDCVYSNHTVSVVVSSPKAHRLGNKVALSKWPK